MSNRASWTYQPHEIILAITMVAMVVMNDTIGKKKLKINPIASNTTTVPDVTSWFNE